MAAVGSLVAGLSHELNNAIGVILGYAQSLLKRSKPDDPLYQPLLVMERQARRCAGLISTLLNFSRNRPLVKEKCRVDDLLRQVLELTAGQARRRQVTLDMDAGDVAELMASVTEIESALLNLINNALDACTAGGKVIIAARSQSANGREGVEISVSDDGCGIPEGQFKKVLDPFFTTKPVGQGTGLGMSLSQQIVKAHGGFLRLRSTPRVGTCVSIWLPALKEPASDEVAEP